MNFEYIDIHSHLNDPRFDTDLPETLSRMRAASVATIVVGTDLEMSRRAIAIAAREPDCWAAIGIHPTDNHKEIFDLTTYQKIAEHPRVVAIGECGIDYYRLDKFEGNKDAEANRQHELFETQVHLAASVDKPLMIHGRPERGTMGAYQDILHILTNAKQKYGDKLRGNVHFFVGDKDIAKAFLDLNFTMSFTGVLTFARDYDEVLRYIPIECIMSETDAPYVAPAPHRGKRNEPAYVVETVKVIARIRAKNEEKIRESLLENAKKTFKI